MILYIAGCQPPIQPSPASGPAVAQQLPPSSPPTARAARAAGKRAPLTASPSPALTSPRHPLPLLLWLTTKAKGGRAGRGPRRRGVPRAPAAHLVRPRVPCRAALFKAAAEPPAELPTLAAPGESPLTAHTVSPEKGVKEGRRWRGAARGRAVRREDRSRPWEEPDPP
jgi:hypothetical protein